MSKRGLVCTLPSIVYPEYHYVVRICASRVTHHLSFILHRHVVPREYSTIKFIVSNQMEACLHSCVACSVNTGSGCTLPIHRWYREEVWRRGISGRRLRPC